MKSTGKNLKYLLILLFSFTLIGIYGCGDNRQNDDVDQLENNETIEENANQDNTEVGVGQNQIVRQGIINVSEIDENDDGYVYQCPMDWNVIADTTGSCPVCGMDLTKFSVSEAKKNLVDNGYQIK